jgi:hypothetical protein
MVVLEGAPEALDGDVIDRTPLAFRADADAFGHTALAEQRGVGLAGELEALAIGSNALWMI